MFSLSSFLSLSHLTTLKIKIKNRNKDEMGLGLVVKKENRTVISVCSKLIRKRNGVTQQPSFPLSEGGCLMAVERLSLAPVAVVVESGSGEDVNKAGRLPRWTRQELLVLIQGKRVAENRVRRGRSAVLAFGSGQVEPKWSSVSSYCKRHGVNRGPVQCRKRWSNLAGDFKKIKEWELSQQESESFWVMRNDLRRERKLPGFFDREVYDILDDDGGIGGGHSSVVVEEHDGEGDKSLLLSLAPSLLATEKEKEVVFDSGRRIDDGLFSDSPGKEPATAPVPISATQYEPSSHHHPPPGTTTQDNEETSPIISPATTHEHGSFRKRKRPAPATDDDDDDDYDEDVSVQKQLIEAMERNGRLLSSQLEIQNTNAHLDREQRKDHATTLFSVLNKLADAMARIADKL